MRGDNGCPNDPDEYERGWRDAKRQIRAWLEGRYTMPSDRARELRLLSNAIEIEVRPAPAALSYNGS